MFDIFRPLLVVALLWSMEQKWFQKSAAKAIAKALKKAGKASEKTETTADDALVDFIKKHKEELIELVTEEAKKSETPFDDMLVEALKDL